jgi:hypothetical protein
MKKNIKTKINLVNEERKFLASFDGPLLEQVIVSIEGYWQDEEPIIVESYMVIKDNIPTRLSGYDSSKPFMSQFNFLKNWKRIK